MAKRKKDNAKLVIPEKMLPSRDSEIIKGHDGLPYLIHNDAMFTGMRHSQGEFSNFFFNLRDAFGILGHRCPQCDVLIIPPFMKRCEECNFVEMHEEYVKDVGVMAASPVITLFAPSRFKSEVPFANGRVFLEDWGGRLTDTAMPIRARTTTGSIRPGIYKKETKVKIVFANNREGSLLDIFAVPQSELTLMQIQKTPLLETDLAWGKIREPSSQAPTKETRTLLARIRSDFKRLGERITQSPRAKENLANWKRAVEVRTPAGNVSFVISNGALTMRKAKPDLILTVPDPAKLALWLCDSLDSGNPQSSPLTDFIMEGSMWLNKSELETITRLDRIPRSLRRDYI